jgi:hypothetical protein
MELPGHVNPDVAGPGWEQFLRAECRLGLHLNCSVSAMKFVDPLLKVELIFEKT